MPLFPQAFLDSLRDQADIVQVVQEYVSLRRVGNSYKGLCPFHAEKTPSFHVDRDRGFFHCFGCGVGGNVFKFLELQERVSFPEAVKMVAHRFGVPLPELQDARPDPGADAEREGLLKAHELAVAFYRDVLASPAGRKGRELIERRGLRPDIVERLGLGFAPPGRDALLSYLRQKGIPAKIAVRSGLVVERDGRLFDRFWNRLMIPIARESGSVIAFGGRAMEADQVPKYLNSPETPIYSKSRTLYGLNLTKHDIRRQGRAVLVEGYFDFALALQAGVTDVVATCGTALTQQQVQLLRRFASRAVLSFDPDAAGQGAAVKSCDLLVREGFDVGVALLPPGKDPDLVVREQGAEAYQALIGGARPYLDFLIERAAAAHDTSTSSGRLAFLNALLPVAAGIPEAAARDQFADRLAVRAGISEDVVRQEIRRAAVARQPSVSPRRLVPAAEMTPAERDLLAQLLTGADEVALAVLELEPADLVGLASRPLLEAAMAVARADAQALPTLLMGRLTEEETALLTGLAARTTRPAPAADCVRTLKQKRHDRERQELQRRIDALQQNGPAVDAAELEELLVRKMQEARAAHPES
ncbi:MAG TPA: DNA primase [Vicinamibacterales bacterium]